MNSTHFNIILSLLVMFSLSCQNKGLSVAIQQKGPEPIAKNIILLIGDGMSVTQITAALYSNDNQLNLEAFKIMGLHKSYSSDNLITDSAAGATAISTGRKTYNGAIGVDTDTVAIKTILEEAEELKYATGLIATSSITHATPASFIAHVASRKMDEAIAEDFLETDIDLFIGGGLKFFNERSDGRDLIAELEKKNYIVSDFEKVPLSKIDIPNESNFAYFTASNSPKKYLQGRNYLKSAMNKALDFLPGKSENGFFLMLESSQIDWGGHDNDQEYIISEMLEFDRIVKIAYDFAKKDGETLLIVTGDHETGGMAITYGSEMNKLVTTYADSGHTADMIPVFAFGPGAEKFGGIYENTALFHKMREAFGWGSID